MCIKWSCQRLRPSPSLCVTFHNTIVFYCAKFLAPKSKDYPLSAVRISRCYVKLSLIRIVGVRNAIGGSRKIESRWLRRYGLFCTVHLPVFLMKTRGYWLQILPAMFRDLLFVVPGKSAICAHTANSHCTIFLFPNACPITLLPEKIKTVARRLSAPSAKIYFFFVTYLPCTQ